MEKIFLFDQNVRKKTKKELLCGVDEVGRGCIAGPLVSAAVVFSSDVYIPQLKESKSVSPKRREKLFKEILSCAKDVSYSIVATQTINYLNVHRANILAMKIAVERVKVDFDIVLVDGYEILGLNKPQLSIIKADIKSAVVAAASIVAKVIRDRIMVLYDKMFPEYKFLLHKGYATKIHRDIISEVGLSEIHRKYAYKFVS